MYTNFTNWTPLGVYNPESAQASLQAVPVWRMTRNLKPIIWDGYCWQSTKNLETLSTSLLYQYVGTPAYCTRNSRRRSKVRGEVWIHQTLNFWWGKSWAFRPYNLLYVVTSLVYRQQVPGISLYKLYTSIMICILFVYVLFINVCIFINVYLV